MFTSFTNTLSKQVLYKRGTPTIAARLGKQNWRLVTSPPPTPPINAVVFAATAAYGRARRSRRLHPDPQRCATGSSRFALMRWPPQRPRACAHRTFTSETCHCLAAATPPHSVCIWGNSLQNAVVRAITALAGTNRRAHVFLRSTVLS